MERDTNISNYIDENTEVQRCKRLAHHHTSMRYSQDLRICVLSTDIWSWTINVTQPLFMGPEGMVTGHCQPETQLHTHTPVGVTSLPKP